MIKKFAGSWYIQLFCILWAAFLFMDYIHASGYYTEAFGYFGYSGLIITFLVLTAGISLLLSNKKNRSRTLEIRNFRGIYHYGFLLGTMALVMFFYVVKTGVGKDAGSGALIFVFKTLFFHLGLGLLFLAAISSGLFLLDRLPVKLNNASFLLVSMALGFFMIALILFILGALGLLYPFVVIPVLLVFLFAGWKRSVNLVKELVFRKSGPFKIHVLAILAYAFTILLMAVNLAFTTRTFPLGYDGLGLYMNVPKLISGYHALTRGGDAYYWSLLMSLGFIVYNNTTLVILISVVPGILSVFAIYRICIQLRLDRNWSLFASALFYSLPNTIWQSRNDEKTDLAMLFITLCGVLLLTSSESPDKKAPTGGRFFKYFHAHPEHAIWVLLGCLVGFSFGIKYVALLSVFAFLVVLFYRDAGKFGAIAIFFLNFAIIFGLNLTRFAAFENDMQLLKVVVPLVFAIAALFFALQKNREGLLTAGKKAVLFLATAGLTFLPWAIKNAVENQKLSVDAVLTGKSPLPELLASARTSGGSSEKIKSGYDRSRTTSAENYFAGFAPTGLLDKIFADNTPTKYDKQDEAVAGSGESPKERYTNDEKMEEIRRYLGYEKGIIRFLSLPYDIVTKSNVRLGSADTGILLLILLPVFIFVFSVRQVPWNLLKMILLVSVLIFSIVSVQYLQGSFDAGAALEALRTGSLPNTSFLGDIFLPLYVFMKGQLLLAGKLLIPAYKYLTVQSPGESFLLIILLTFPLYFLFRSSFSGMSTMSKTTIAFVYGILQYWLILSSGIIWYGIAGFSLVPAVIALLTNKEAPDTTAGKFHRRYVTVCASVWFILILPFQFMPAKFLYTADKSTLNTNEFLDPQFARYAIGEQDERKVFTNFFSPQQQSILNTLNRDKEAKILNVSTFFTYFIVNNDTRVYKDNQLGIFKELYARGNKKKYRLAGEFRKNDIKYILVSLNTPNIDNTPDKSLTKKFDELMTALVNNPEVRLLYTNRIVERPDGDMDIPVNGSMVKARYDVLGKRILKPGSDALFEIL